MNKDSDIYSSAFQGSDALLAPNMRERKMNEDVNRLNWEVTLAMCVYDFPPSKTTTINIAVLGPSSVP